MPAFLGHQLVEDVVAVSGGGSKGGAHEVFSPGTLDPLLPRGEAPSLRVAPGRNHH